MNNQEVLPGSMVRAKRDRTFKFDGQAPFDVWVEGQILFVRGVWKWHPKAVTEVIVGIDELNHEHVPMPIFQEEFEVLADPSC